MTPLDPALLRAVLANPEEDLPRLLCAEWLDENAEMVKCPKCHGKPKGVRPWKPKPKTHTGWKEAFRKCECGSGRVSDGAAERAEFIRVQVEMARMPGPTQFPEGGVWLSRDAIHHSGRYDALRRRERDLWQMRETGTGYRFGPFDWFPVLSGLNMNSNPGSLTMHWRDLETHAPVIEAPVRRGFVSSLSCTAAAFLEHAPAIFAAQPVVSVTISDAPVWTVTSHRNGYWLIMYSGLPLPVGKYLMDLGDERYDTEADARAALSAACVNWGRALVGLPSLPTRTETAPVPDEVMR